MAIKYNGNKAVLSGMREDVVAPNDFWQDFTKFLTKADYYNTKFKGNYDSYFGGLTADWDAQDYQNFFNTNGITDAVQGNSNVDISKITDLNKLKAIMGSMVIDQKGHFSNNKYKLPGTEINKLKEGIKAYNAHNQLVTNLRNKGGTDEQIQGILDSRDGSADSYTSLYDEIENLSGDEWNNYVNQNFADEGILPDGTFGEYTIPTNVTSVANADTIDKTVNQQITEAVVGDSSLDALRKEEGFREENGRYFVGDQEYAYDEKNDQVVFVGGDKAGDRWTPEGSGMADQYDTLTEQEQQAIAQQQGVVDQLVGTDEVDPVTGEKVTPGLVNEYGDFVDKTLSAIDAEENDFAGQINAQLNQFLTGKDAKGNVVGKGFLDYQTDLETAGTTLETGLTELQGLYNQAYKDYENELDPLRGEIGRIRGRLGDVADRQMDVARDAGDESYYSRLSDLYYQDAKDQLDASAAGARETLNEAYANAGLDPSSPAFTAAMKDLAMSRAGAERQAQRQSILDSYGLGSQMLTNRTTALSGAGNALGNEMAGVQTEMGALDSLYGVKLQGLNQRQDMIGQIYNTKANNANVGMQGLNTVLNTNLKGIDANQNQFNTKISLTNDLFKNKAGMYGTAYDTIGGMRGVYDKESGDRFNTLTEFDQGTKSDAFILESLQQQASQNPNYEVPQWIIDIYGGNK